MSQSVHDITHHQWEQYERVAYPCGAYPQAHPERLAAMGILFGMNPAPISTARILELGCGDGAHCIPIAYHFPKSKVVGIDLSPAHIERGQTFINTLALHNCTLHVGDILALTHQELGEFDYIIAHGVYSWIPESVQKQLLTLCRSCLSPHGIAYISYNTQPGGHIRSMVRDMMLSVVRQYHDPQDRVTHARNFLRFMATSTEREQTGTPEYRAVLQAELQRIDAMPDHVLFHDDLDDYAQPCSFTEFMQRVQKHGLRYVGEADLVEMQEHFFSATTQEQLVNYGGDDMIQREQLLDYIKYRRFRQTLLCRDDVDIQHIIDPSVLTKLYFAVSARVTHESQGIVYTNMNGVAVVAHTSLERAILDVLSAHYPLALSIENIFEKIRPILLAEQGLRVEQSTREDVRDVVVHLLMADMVEYHAVQLSVADLSFLEENIHEYRPKASVYARLQAQSQPEITTIRHSDVVLTDPLARLILLSATGEHTISVLALMIERLLETTPMVLPKEYDHLPLAIDKLLHVLRKLIVLGLLERNRDYKGA